MSSQIDAVDSIIREALHGMTAGAPRPGLRGRVLARIGKTAGPTHGAPRWFGRVRPSTQLVHLEVLGVIGLVLALVLPQLLRRGPTTPPSASQDLQASAQMLGAAAVQSVPTDAFGPERVSARDARPSAPSTRPWADDDASTESSIVVIAPLGDPAPIAMKAITLAPLEFQPVAHDEIEIRLLESTWPPKGPN